MSKPKCSTCQLSLVCRASIPPRDSGRGLRLCPAHQMVFMYRGGIFMRTGIPRSTLLGRAPRDCTVRQCQYDETFGCPRRRSTGVCYINEVCNAEPER
jgi:hypothetical protein